MSAQQMYNADDLMQRITIDPHICHGKPCIRGLRYPVEILLELLSAGMTVEEILADYEDLEREDIFATPGFCHPPEPGEAYAAARSMKFLVDAHLPRRLAYQLRAFGHEAVHTLDLPRGNRIPDPKGAAGRVLGAIVSDASTAAKYL
jgi:uncharacterized protein (DUF433 family)